MSLRPLRRTALAIAVVTVVLALGTGTAHAIPADAVVRGTRNMTFSVSGTRSCSFASSATLDMLTVHGTVGQVGMERMTGCVASPAYLLQVRYVARSTYISRVATIIHEVNVDILVAAGNILCRRVFTVPSAQNGTVLDVAPLVWVSIARSATFTCGAETVAITARFQEGRQAIEVP